MKDDRLQKVFNGAAREARRASWKGRDCAVLLYPDEFRAAPRPLLNGDRLAGVLLYLPLTPFCVKNFANVVEGRPDSGKLMAALTTGASVWRCSTLAEFDRRYAPMAELALVEPALALEQAKSAIDSMSEEADAWLDYLEASQEQSGLVQFEMSAISTSDGVPLFYSQMNFDCPLFKPEFSTRLCMEKIDQENLPESCFQAIRGQFPALSGMEKPKAAFRPGRQQRWPR